LLALNDNRIKLILFHNFISSYSFHLSEQKSNKYPKLEFRKKKEKDHK